MMPVTPPCPTIIRLNALGPGEEMRYLSEVEGATSGPAVYRDLIDRIKDHAAGLELAGRIARRTQTRVLRSTGRKPALITEYFAIGKGTS
jgi:hypothetical protein